MRFVIHRQDYEQLLKKFSPLHPQFRAEEPPYTPSCGLLADVGMMATGLKNISTVSLDTAKVAKNLRCVHVIMLLF